VAAGVFEQAASLAQRERETLDLLPNTTITPWQILCGKLVADCEVTSRAYDVSAVEGVLACVMVKTSNGRTGRPWRYMLIVVSPD